MQYENNVMFTGTMPALVTPFDKNCKLKRNTVKELIDWQLSEGSTGFYICGWTGEGPALSASLRMEMAEATVEAVAGRGAVINHIGAANVYEAIALTEHADKIGVDAVASLVPTYFYQLTPDELFDYYKTIAAHTDKPVLVYALPSVKGFDFPTFMERLMEIPNVIGLKCTIGDDFIQHKLKEINGGNINVINGPDETLICGLTMGADGGIGSTYNVMPGWFAKLFDSFKAGDLATAQEYQYKANRVIDALLRFSKFGAIRGTKAALALKGFDVGDAIFPARPYDKDELLAYKKELSGLGIEF